MSISKEKKEFAMEMLTAMVIEDRAEKDQRSYKELIKEFRKSNTMKMLFNEETGLWMNGPAYIDDEWTIEKRAMGK